MGMLKKGKKKEETAPTEEETKKEAPELPAFFMELGMEANVPSQLVANNGPLHRLNSLSFITPDMSDEQLQQILAQLDACMSDTGIVRVGFFPATKSEAQKSGEEEAHDD